MRWARQLTIFPILLLIAPLELNPAAVRSGDATADIYGLVNSGRLSDLKWPNFPDYRTRIQSFYEPTAYAFAWTTNGRATDQATSIVGILNRADAKGLDAEDYDGSRWAGRLEALRHPAASSSDLARFDLALTVCIMRYISDLHLGKVNPGSFHSHFDLGKDDVAGFIRRRLVNADNVEQVLQEVEPPYEGYRRTEQALQRYLSLAREEGEGLLPITKHPVEPGTSYVAMTQLARLLTRLGDLPSGAILTKDSTLYEGPLVDALTRFQTRHGLQPDGRIGNSTFAQLNTPLTHRVRQLRLTLERWRWLPHAFAQPPVVVNIPEFTLRALSDSYSTEVEMKVIVGRAYRHQTPVFAAEMTYVVFRPYWNVPLSIQRAELVPTLVRDPSYLVKNGFEVVTPQKTIVTRGIVDDDILTQLRIGKLQIRQTPGSKNALGLIAFMFPNEYNVYLHATPAQELFLRARRDFSHGCIRVEKPVELAAWVLRNHPEWTTERMQDAMNGGTTIRVNLERPIPVFIVYATAVALRSGEIRFFEDIYGQDGQMERLLAKGYPSHR